DETGGDVLGPPGRVVGAPDLERADRLEVLELQVDLGLRLGHVQPDERGADGRARDRLARGPDLLERDQNATSVPAPFSRARRTTYSAAARSSTARPRERKTVSSPGSVRPVAAPISTSPISALMWSGPIAPDPSASR